MRKAGMFLAIKRLGSCSEALEWLATQKSASEAWKNCERGDWMLWLLGRLSGPVDNASRKRLVLVAAECAATALPIFEKRYPHDKRVRKCINMVRRYARGKATIEQVREARRNASDASAAAAYAAAYAAADAAYASDASAAAAYAAAYAAADAAYAAAYAAAAADAAYAAAAYAAAYAAAAADARSKALKKCAVIVRKHYPNAPIIKESDK